MSVIRMHALASLLMAVLVAIYYVLESIVLSIVPKSYRYKDVSNDTVLITGAGSGIGRQLAKRFADLGSRLVLLDINVKGLKETSDMVSKTNSSVYIYECDLSKREAIYAVAEKIKDEVGVVTILVNNAGIVTGKKFIECPDEMITKTMEVNTLAHFWTCKAFLPDMIAANHGHIVSVASLAGYGAMSKLTDYCASKFAAVGFEEALSIELRQDNHTGIKTTVVAPYLVQTGLFEGFQFSLHKPLTTEYVADEIVSGILVNQEVVFIPSYAYIAVVLMALLPRTAIRTLYEASGLSDCMNAFTGRPQEA